MYEIQISNSQQLLSISTAFIEEIVSKTLAAQNVVAAEIVVALVDDEAIHAVNREHLQHDYPTDVISFLYDDRFDETTSKSSVQKRGVQKRGAGKHLDGELIVSTETAIREAEQYLWLAQQELQLYIVHGLLHLCGYDDLSESELTIMRQQERETLRIWDLTPHYDE